MMPAASTRLHETQLEAVGVGEHEQPLAPWHVLGLLVEDAAARLDLRGQPIEVLRRDAAETEPDALRPVPSLGEVVLAQHERHGAGLELGAGECTVLAPFLADHEAEHVAIERDAALQVGGGQGRRDAAQPQRLGLLPRRRTRDGLGGALRQLLDGGHRGSLHNARGNSSVAYRRQPRQIPRFPTYQPRKPTMPTSNATAAWEGKLKDGKGTVKAQSGAFSGPFSYGTRFGDAKGTNPEELIAAAHAACFSMALSAGLEKAGTPVTRVETRASCTLEMVDGAPKITRIALTTRGKVPGLDQAGFQKAAEEAKNNCPVSKALKGNVDFTLDAKLE